MKKLKGKTLYDIKMYILKKLQRYVLKSAYGGFGKNSVIEAPLVIRNKSRINIGSNVVIRRGARIEVITKYNDKIYAPNLKIGDNTVIEFNFHVTCASKIIIENDVLIAGNVTIVDNNHGYEDITKPILKNDLTKPIDVTVGESSFIGMGARVMPGVNIGKHCIIGANSVVNKDIPNYSVAVGNPVKVVKKYNFNTQKWERTNEKGQFLSENI